MIDEQRHGGFHTDSSPTVVGMAFFFGVVLLGILLWLPIEIGRYQAAKSQFGELYFSRRVFADDTRPQANGRRSKNRITISVAQRRKR
jgi:hypothetical protein